eukprot:scaffold276_cov132-Cylindrotheca_fusiformis.AAC.8
MAILTATSPFATCAIATFGLQFLGFLVAFALQTEKFYDVLGALNFFLIGIWTFVAGTTEQGFDAVSVGATVVFLTSRLWLLIFLGWRAHERKGDSRFDGVRDKAGMFLVYWMVQAMWVYFISLPTIYINTIASMDDQVASSESLSVYEAVILGIFSAAVVLEVTADVQKAVWVRKGRQGGFCSVGVWKFSRHPNYFGEILLWCASFLLILPTVINHPTFYGWSCILSPVFTLWILLFATGTGLTSAEGKGLKRYYEDENISDDYKAYRANTSILIPMVGYSSIPTWIKRTFLFEWKRFEYTPSRSRSSRNPATGKKDE